jgi:hypothetical protein
MPPVTGGIACVKCHEMATELVLVMRSHLQAEGDLVEAMFAKKDAAIAHAANIRAAELLAQRKDLVLRFKAHIGQAHGHGSRSTEFALP